MSNKLSSLLLVLALAVAAVGVCLFTVYETDQALILRLGKIRTDSDNHVAIYKPGLHLKVPVIDEVRKFDMRLNILDIKKSRITTVEKKDVLVDYYVKWRIEDLELFYNRTEGGRVAKGEFLLERIAVSSLISEFGRLTIKEVVSGERIELMERIRKVTDSNAEKMGVTVLDVRVKRIDLPDEVSESVYNRMRAERQRKANSFRADGEKAAISIRADADKQTRVIIAEAEKEVKRLRGEGDAKAVEIYAETYNRSPEFYEFYRSIEAYKQTFKDKNDVLVLKPDGDFFKYFRNKEDRSS